MNERTWPVVGSVYARIQPGEVSCQHFLSLGPVLERPLDGSFTRNEIPLIHRVKKSAITKSRLLFRFAFAYGRHGHLTLKILFIVPIQHQVGQAINQATSEINPNGANAHGWGLRLPVDAASLVSRGIRLGPRAE